MRSKLLWDVATRDFILDDIDEAICAVDNDGIVTIWNKKSEQIYDLPKEEILGKKMDEVLPDTVIMKVLQTKEEQQNIYTSTRTGCNILVKAKILYDELDMIGVVCVDKDLSEIAKLQEQVDTLQERVEFLESQNLSEQSSGIIGNSTKMVELMYKMNQIAKTDVNVLISGESGVGKKALARELHRMSRREGIFISVNCGAIPATLFEEEFFGIELANDERAGFFELANEGTLYLSGISNMSLEMQSKLLNALQNMEISRLGSKRKIQINARIIASSAKNIKEQVERGEFLEELYYRLNVIELKIPPLRERGSDITLLADFFLRELAEKYQVKQPSISPRVMNVLLEYEWGGNLRELRNIMEHMIVMCGGEEITMEMVPYAVKESAAKFARSYSQINDLAKTVGEYEKHIIEEALENCNWNKSQTSRLLNIPRTTLMYKIEQYQLKEFPSKRRK